MLATLSSGILAVAGSTTGTGCVSGDTWCFTAQSAVSAALHIAVIVALAFAIRYLSHRIITRLVRRTAGGLPLPLRRLRGKARELLEVTDELPVINERRDQRAQTIGSVLKSIASTFILGTGFVMVLRELGLDIAPVLTSAGIVGVAVGFGAQNLVRDFLSGIFMILEDQYGVGDVIDVGAAAGTVEAVGLRTTRVRDVNGTVWHVRNGEIARVGNMSQNWSRAVLDIPVGYAADADRAAAVIKSAAEAVWHDPQWEEAILEEPQVWGIEQFTPDSFVVRLVVKTRPLKQWDVARAVRARLKVDFASAGLEIPPARHVVRVRSELEPGERGDGAAGRSEPSQPGAGRSEPGLRP